MAEKNIGIVGYGHVGKAMHDLLRSRTKAFFDPIFKDDVGIPNDKEEFKNIDIAIICVPTPLAKEGYCDVSLVEESVAWLVKINPKIKNITVAINPNIGPNLYSKL